MQQDIEKFGDQLARRLAQPGQGARMTGASARSSFAGGNIGTGAELTTLPTPTGETKMEWLVGDPFTSEYYFPAYTPLNIFGGTDDA